LINKPKYAKVSLTKNYNAETINGVLGDKSN
jgi:hypothetical protein